EREGPNNRADIMAAWSEMKPVAHLLCAFLLLWIEVKHSKPEAGMGEVHDVYFGSFARFLSLARTVQHFGLTFRAHGQRTPLLVRENIWAIPDGLVLPRITLNFERLPDEYMAALKNYRAPVRV